MCAIAAFSAKLANLNRLPRGLSVHRSFAVDIIAKGKKITLANNNPHILQESDINSHRCMKTDTSSVQTSVNASVNSLVLQSRFQSRFQSRPKSKIQVKSFRKTPRACRCGCCRLRAGRQRSHLRRKQGCVCMDATKPYSLLQSFAPVSLILRFPLRTK